MLDEFSWIKNMIIIWSCCLLWGYQSWSAFSMVSVPIISLLFKCAADGEMETLSIGKKDQDDPILSRIMTAPHSYDFMKTFPITLFCTVNDLPPLNLYVHPSKQLHVSWIRQSEFQQYIYCVYTTYIVLCFVTFYTWMYKHLQKKRSSSQLSAVAAISCCQVQFFWCDGKCLGTCCVFSRVHFSDYHLSLAQLKAVALTCSPTPRSLQSMSLCLQLEMKEFHFFPLVPLWPPSSLLSGIQPQSSDPQRGLGNFHQHERANKAVRQRGGWSGVTQSVREELTEKSVMGMW